MSGVICKIWNIHGSTLFKGNSAQLSDSISYILNEEKTKCKLSMEDSIINDTLAQLSRECQYVDNDVKTLNGTYVGTQNLISDDICGAIDEMMKVKEFYEKTDGRAALHGVISLSEEESKMSNVSDLMKMCGEVLKELFPDNQAIFAVHTNTDNLHVHFIVNSVGLNGKKIHQDKKFVKNVLQPCINKYAKKYGFTHNDKWEKSTENKKSFSNIKNEMRHLIDYAIENSNNFEEFISELNKNNVFVSIGKHISLKTDEMQKAIRTYQLGANYTKDAIVERIETKYNALHGVDIHKYTMEPVKDVFTPQIMKVKKYKDMSPDEKRYVMKSLKTGRNPWRANQKLNWQINNIAKELNAASRIIELSKFYSKDGTLYGALEGILEAKKKLSIEKKELKAQIKRYKPIIDIYEDMKEISKKAYLYDIEGIEEYRYEYEKYRELGGRLAKGYGKNVIEVAKFIEECQDRILFAQAQFDELSEEYKEIKRYGIERGEIKKQGKSLYDISEVGKMFKERGQGIFDTDVSYVVSKESNYMVRIFKFSERDTLGRLQEKIEITVMDQNGRVKEQTVSLANKEFNKVLYEIQNKYVFHTCDKYESISGARNYLYAKNKSMVKKDDIKLHKESIYSFTQAINVNSQKNMEGIHAIANADNPNFVAIVTTKKDVIDIQITNKAGDVMEKIEIPAFRLKNKEGMNELVRIQKEFGFSDEIISYESVEDIRSYTETKENENDKNRAEKRR